MTGHCACRALRPKHAYHDQFRSQRSGHAAAASGACVAQIVLFGRWGSHHHSIGDFGGLAEGVVVYRVCRIALASALVLLCLLAVNEAGRAMATGSPQLSSGHTLGRPRAWLAPLGKTVAVASLLALDALLFKPVEPNENRAWTSFGGPQHVSAIVTAARKGEADTADDFESLAQNAPKRHQENYGFLAAFSKVALAAAEIARDPRSARYRQRLAEALGAEGSDRLVDRPAQVAAIQLLDEVARDLERVQAALAGTRRADKAIEAVIARAASTEGGGPLTAAVTRYVAAKARVEAEVEALDDLRIEGRHQLRAAVLTVLSQADPTVAAVSELYDLAFALQQQTRQLWHPLHRLGFALHRAGELDGPITKLYWSFEDASNAMEKREEAASLDQSLREANRWLDRAQLHFEGWKTQLASIANSPKLKRLNALVRRLNREAGKSIYRPVAMRLPWAWSAPVPADPRLGPEGLDPFSERWSATKRRGFDVALTQLSMQDHVTKPLASGTSAILELAHRQINRWIDARIAKLERGAGAGDS